MSGLEAAGVVLGAFPLLISALEHYRDVTDAVGVFWKIRREHRKWMHELKICSLAFERNLQFLLLPLVADDDTIEKLLSDPGGSMWSDPDLDAKLKQRLPKAYDLYLTSMKYIGETTDQMEEELGLKDAEFRLKILSRSDSETRLWANVSDFKTNTSLLMRRLKLSFHQTKREELFRDLNKGNDQLRTLLDSSDRVADLQKSRGVAKKIADIRGLREFWRQTDKLYRVLSRSWNCQCKGLHSARLRLEHRTTPNADFRVCFCNSGENKTDDDELRWVVQETEIRFLDHQPDDTTGRKQRVSFAPASTNVQNLPQVTITNSCSPGLTEPANLKSKAMSRIFCLCKEIPNIRPETYHKQSYFLRDENCSISLHPVPRAAGQSLNHPARNEVSLDSLINKSASQRLTRQQRYIIGLTLASSYLQLKSSPWIRDHWDKRSILFSRDEPTSGGTLVGRPYISKDFEHEQSQEQDSLYEEAPGGHSEPPITQSGHIAPNDRTLKNLGIMLLELCFDTTLEESGPRKKYGDRPSSGNTENDTTSLFIDVAAAFEWSEQVVAEAGPEFSDAVAWCLTTIPNQHGDCTQSNKWRDDLFEKVIMPLKYCCDQFTNRHHFSFRG